MRALFLALLLPAAAWADEGQWPPDRLKELDPAQLKALGLRLTPQELWNEKDGLMRAAINYSGCSAAFVSADGLFTTNHHCAYPAIQAQSAPEHDYLTQGFLAGSRAQELEAKGRSTAMVLEAITDITPMVRAAVDAAPDDLARQQALEQLKKQQIAACEAQAGRRCDVAEFYLGSEFKLMQYLELKDIRIVYAPPSSIGEYGGEIDNWMWPRHTGDFSLLRAYIGKDGQPKGYDPENVPYRPQHFLKISPEGLQPGNFVAILGYPGRTLRYLPPTEVQRYQDQIFPGVIDLYGEWIELLEAAGTKNKAVQIKVAALKKILANRKKNAEGQLDGFKKMQLMAKKEVEAQAITAWLAQPGNATLVPTAAALQKLVADAHDNFTREFLLENIGRTNLIGTAVDLARRAREFQKPDMEREAAYMDRNAEKLWKGIEQRLRDYDLGVETALGSSFARRYPAGQVAVDKVLGGLAGREKRVAALLKRSKLSNPKFTKKLFDEPARVKRGMDPLLDFGLILAEATEAQEKLKKARTGAWLRLGPDWVKILKGVRKGPFYPDANGTLRVSFASVKGYSPQEGLVAMPQTTLQGALVKHTGQVPFNLPEKVRNAAATAKTSRWADSKLGDLVLCHLTNGDTTGGNSGSAVVDGQGRLVGFNFDRVWENIAGDFGYSPERSRNIIADARYLWWLLELEGAQWLLDELGLTKK